MKELIFSTIYVQYYHLIVKRTCQAGGNWWIHNFYSIFNGFCNISKHLNWVIWVKNIMATKRSINQFETLFLTELYIGLTENWSDDLQPILWNYCFPMLTEAHFLGIPQWEYCRQSPCNNRIHFHWYNTMDQLRPFFTLCQACGMIPYSINYNFKTNVKTVRFSFSFRNFVTWWFLAILVLQLGIPCMIFVFSQMFFTDVSSDGEAPVTITVLGTSTVFCFVAQLFVARWIVLRYYKLFRHIIKSAYVIERLLQVGNHQVGNSITKRFYSALLLIAMVVSSSIIIHTLLKLKRDILKMTSNLCFISGLFPFLFRVHVTPCLRYHCWSKC